MNNIGIDVGTNNHNIYIQGDFSKHAHHHVSPP